MTDRVAQPSAHRSRALLFEADAQQSAMTSPEVCMAIDDALPAEGRVQLRKAFARAIRA